jgi:peptidyl-tRNA hydrolase, PTH1 family
MKIYVGLGNPGDKYQKTRHNAGFMFVDAAAKELDLAFKFEKKFNAALAVKRDDLFLLKPQTFMNNSGQALRAFLDYLKIDLQNSLSGPEDLIVVHDDLDLELGNFKLQKAVGPKDHNGLQSIYQHLGTKDFWHLRLGVDSRKGVRNISPADYVLQVMSKTESQIFNKTVKVLLQELL